MMAKILDHIVLQKLMNFGVGLTTRMGGFLCVVFFFILFVSVHIISVTEIGV